MPVFNVASVFGKKGGGGSAQTYNTLVDQLSIMENQLETDGKLSPGDYDLLLETAQKFYGTPGLNAGQRSNIEVKMSQYKKGKGNVKIKDAEDVAGLNDELQDSLTTNVRALGNNPRQFAQANHDAAMAKVARLAEMVDTLDDSGADSTKLRMEYLDSINELQEAQQVLQDMSLYQKGSAPSSKKVVYVDTNDRGEITNVSIGRPGEKGKYIPTNGVYGGLQVYGMPNGVENGNKIFRLGETTFQAPDIIEPDPENPLATRVRPLMSSDTLKQAGKVDIGKISIYKDLDENNLRVQSLIPNGGWARGQKGVIYKRNANGKYTKYVNADLEQLGVTPNNVISLPKAFESSLVGDIENTVDPTLLNLNVPTTPTALPDVGPSPAPGPALEMPPIETKTSTATGLPKTPAPTERAPQQAQGIASRAYAGAKNFLSNIFG